MGCEQSAERKVTPEGNRWSTKISPKKIQVFSNGNTGKEVMANKDPVAIKRAQEFMLQYLSNEEKIDSMEKTEPLTMFYIKKSHLDSISFRINELTDRIKDLESKTQGANYFRYKTVKNTFLRLGDKALGKEDHEFLSIVNSLEVAQTELEMAHQEKALVEQEVESLQASLIDLKEAYKQQEDLLGKLSMNGETPEEEKIQHELEDIESKRIKISEIYERWKEGRLLVCESCRHFSTALAKLQTTEWESFNHLEQYESGEDIRDNLVNAMQCLNNAKFYISLPLPYCSPSELAVLDKAITYLFIDLRSPERRKHAELCYTAVHKRAVALFGWIDKTIEFVVEPELRLVTKVINEKLQKLKQIRTDELNKRFPAVISKYNVNDPISRQSSTSMLGSTWTLDPETEKIFTELEFDQLSPLPSLEEMSVTTRNVDDIVENHVNASKGISDYNSQDLEIGLEENITPRRKLSRKLILLEGTIL